MLWNPATRQFGLCIALVMALLPFVPCSRAIANETVWACGSSYGTGVFGSSAPPDMSAHVNCPALPQTGGGLVLQNAFANVAKGQVARWQATAPSGLLIVGAGVPSLFVGGVNDGEGYGGGFYWSGGGAEANRFGDRGTIGELLLLVFRLSADLRRKSMQEQPEPLDPSRRDRAERSRSRRPRDHGARRPVADLGLGARPVAGGLRRRLAVGGVRTRREAQRTGASRVPLGTERLCMGSECAAPGVAKTIDVDQYGQGALPLSLIASDAAGNTASATKTVYVDSTTPTLSLSGPINAPSTAGTQYIVATAGGSPSGIAGISCSVGGNPRSGIPGVRLRFRLAESARTPSTARPPTTPSDGAGQHGWSTSQSWTLRIGVPTISAIGFSKIVDALLCRRARKRVEIPAHWVTVRRHHRSIRIKEEAHSQVVKVTRCHPRTERKRITVWVTIHRHGKKVRVKRRELRRVVLLPHVVNRTTRRAAHGRRTTVNGWLGTSTGVALPGQPVSVITAADNGQGRFRLAAAVTTTNDGSWSATLPAGPSRLVEAVYSGSPTTEPANSGQVHVIVPATVKLLSILPRGSRGAAPFG